MLLYVRMLLTMAVSLYTSRVVLNVLGIEDFGIYNVVGGIVAMFSFLNTAMAAGTQRYLTFELGKGNMEQLKKVFSTSLQIHVLIVLLVICLAETIGLWFLYNKMTIPPDRMDAAMKAFAYIGIIDAVLKLLIVYLLLLGDFDKLKLYAVLILGVQMSIQVIYQLYCKRQFTETKYHWTYDKKLFKEMTAFVGWNLWGNCAAIAFTQGINILLNMFFGPVVNAARGISVQVQNAVNQFSFNFQTALNPQITKSYAAEDREYMFSLVERGSRFSFYIMLILALPILFETEFILTLWLKQFPEHTVNFVRLILLLTLCDVLSNTLITLQLATGKIRYYQIAVGGVLLMNFPLSYLCLWMGFPPESTILVAILISLACLLLRLLFLRSMVGLPVRHYLRNVCGNVVGIAIMAALFPILVYCMMHEGWLRFMVITLVCFISVGIVVYFIGCTKSERKFILDKMLAIKMKLIR